MSFSLAAAVWIALSWHGGLHPWQQALAALGLAALVWRERGSLPSWRDWGSTERVLGCLLLVQACCVVSSLRPQDSFNAAAALALALAAALLLRRRPGTTPGRVAALLQFGGAAYAAVFVGVGLWERWWGSGPADSVYAARLLFPNQNLLASGLALPAFLLGLAGLASPERPARRKLWDGLCVVLGSFALVYAGSRGADGALAIALVWLLLRWGPGSRRRLAVWLVPVLLAVMTLTAWAPFSRLAVRLRRQAKPGMGDVDYYRRFDFWKAALDLSLDRPLLGRGLGCFGAAAYRLDVPNILTPDVPIARYRMILDHAHNEWLELAVETGWPCVLLLALCALAWLGRRWRVKGEDAEGLGLEAVLLAAGALSLVDMNLRTPALAWGLILCFCALEPRPVAETGPPGKGAWGALAVLVLAVFCLGGAALARRFRQDKQAGLSTAAEAQAALCLQPLDAELAADALGQATAWPWSAWAGREDPVWWWSQAIRAGTPTAQEADAREAVALRPYFAPGWYWLGLKLAQDGHASEASQAMARALELEPNFVRVLAWEAQQARARKDAVTEAGMEQRMRAVEAMKTSARDAYTGYIRSLAAPSFTR